MSFILDALKKSEVERQRQSVPGLIDTRAAAVRRRLPAWALVLAALLAINLLVLTLVLAHKGWPPAQSPPPASLANGAQDSPAVEGMSATAAAPAIEAVSPAAKPFSPLDGAPVYAPEIPVAASISRAPVNGAMAAVPGSHRAHHSDPLLTDGDASAETQEVLPSISEVNLTGAQALPELHLDVHVYSTNPSERFVYVNMRKYHEGAVLQEGPTVERIRRDGVVLNFQGLRFVLPRQP